MNSNDFDWHAAGVWVALDANQEPCFETMASTPYSCRASLLGRMNKRWSALKDEGWFIQEFVPAIPVLTDVIKVGDQVAVSSADRWRYPLNNEPAPPGVTVQLLTRGGVVVRGQWNDLGDYIAWAPMIKRDKELEERLGL
jgi:hypothetical protein